LTTLNSYFENHPLVTKRADGLYYQNNFSFEGFEKQYIELRKKENRLHSDEETRQLPHVGADHPHHAEWVIRELSTQRLITHLKEQHFNNLLEVGCGNGWLTNQLSKSLDADVCGIDVNNFELSQAVKLFSNDKITFFQTDIFSETLPANFFDAVVFASSIQYFPNIGKVLQKIFPLIHPSGEVHIIDTPFYSPQQIVDAHIRTKKYFAQIGFPEMSNNYFHHSPDALSTYNFSYGHNPSSIYQRTIKALFRKLHSPFPWIIIKKK
jgi:ubiquinone/menaquinone biosynthesis C-methylase UbiE